MRFASLPLSDPKRDWQAEHRVRLGGLSRRLLAVANVCPLVRGPTGDNGDAIARLSVSAGNPLSLLVWEDVCQGVVGHKRSLVRQTNRTRFWGRRRVGLDLISNASRLPAAAMSAVFLGDC